MIHRGTWRAHGSTGLYGKRPTPGHILAINFRAWRVLDIVDVLPIDPERPEYILGVAPISGDGSEGDRHILTVRERSAKPSRFEGGEFYIGSTGGSPNFDVLDEHFAVCGRCGDVQPCREVWAEAQGAHAVEELMRFDDPSVCPACQEPITLRQKTVALPNVVSPLGGIVTLHTRLRCLRSAIGYEKRVLKAGAIPALTLSCDGRLIHHVDDTFECLNLDCPDVHAAHGHYERCQYRSHGCPRLECQIAVAS